MFETIFIFLNKLNVNKNERQKLQYSFLMLAVLIVLTSGIISLFNARAGHDVVKIALAAIIAFLANAIVWNLLYSGLLSKLPSKPKRS